VMEAALSLGPFVLLVALLIAAAALDRSGR
jgi:hypothetical protein